MRRREQAATDAAHQVTLVPTAGTVEDGGSRVIEYIAVRRVDVG